MAFLNLGAGEGLEYDHRPPAASNGVTFVGVNALTGDLTMWEQAVGETLRAAGHGTLFYNLRGQAGSPVADHRALDEPLISADLTRLLAAVAPARAVLVGLSIGGLFAARAILGGARADALVLINTLRRPGPRLAWVNAAVLRCSDVGGPALLKDLYAPLLFGGAWLAQNRDAAFSAGDYEPIEPGSTARRLLADTGGADWDIPYEALGLPVLVITGGQDRLFRIAADVDAMVARLPDATRHDLPDVGHLVPVEAPRALADALLDFVSAV